MGDHVGDDPAAVAANRDRLLQATGLEDIVWMEQLHTNTVTVVGQKWSWTFNYDNSQVWDAGTIERTPDLYLPVNESTTFELRSPDVIHSFWVPRLAGKIDAIPGHENVLRIEADRPGTYRGVCAEFCGDGHTRMRFTVIAHEPQDYEAARAAAIARSRR